MRILPLALACALACAGEADAPGSEGAPAGAGSPPDTAPFVAFEAAGVPSWTPMRERGIGVVHFDPGPGLSGRVEDTLVARDESGLALARLIADTLGLYRFEARPGALDAPAALEFGYEEIGLPLLAESAQGWRVHLGTLAGAPVGGWVRPETGRNARTLWEDLLPTMPLFFVVPPDSIRFRASRDGPVAPFAVPTPPTGGDPGDPGDYILWPLETSGDWMQVRAVTPSDYCTDPPVLRQDTLWIRWRREDGRPRVWFFTRGC